MINEDNDIIDINVNHAEIENIKKENYYILNSITNEIGIHLLDGQKVCIKGHDFSKNKKIEFNFFISGIIGKKNGEINYVCKPLV